VKALLIPAWFALFVYALARTTVWMQDWSRKRSLELEEERRELARAMVRDIRRERWLRGHKDEWL
jgi:hypothetical protein